VTVVASVAVVVPTHDRADRLERLVAALERQESTRPFSVVVVDDGSHDETWTVLEKLAASTRLPLVPLRLDPGRGPATARNLGWQATDAGVIAFTDDDCVPAPGWLEALAEEAERAGMAQGQTLPDPTQASGSGPFSRTLAVTEATGYYQTCNMAYRRDVLERLGGFDERFRHPTGEDTDLAWRALEDGVEAEFVPAAVVYHDVRPSSFVAHLRDTRRWEGVVLAVRLHPRLRDRFHRRWFWKPSHPPAIAAALGAVLAAGPRSSTARRLLGLAMIAPYIRYRSLVLPLDGGPRRRLAAIPLALVADLAEVAVLASASARYKTLLL
jgi:glycosyltransferase involved in cell wall biosynthesis